MFRKAVLLGCVIAGTGWALAQQTQDIDPDLLAYFEEIEAGTGAKRFGPTHLGELEGGDGETVGVTVDPNTYTIVAVICGPSCEEITATVRDSAGNVIAPAPEASYEAIIQIPPGNGAHVDVSVDMVACDWETCPYAIQSFTRPGN